MDTYKRFTNKDKFWEIYYHTDTNELLIRKGIIGEDGIIEIQSGFDGDKWLSIYNNKVDEKNNINIDIEIWSQTELILNEYDLVDLRLSQYDYEGNLITI